MIRGKPCSSNNKDQFRTEEEKASGWLDSKQEAAWIERASPRVGWERRTRDVLMGEGRMFDEQMELAPKLSEGRPLRKAVRDLCEQAGIADEAASDFLLAISEAFSNAVRYGTTPAEEPIRVRVWVSRIEARLSLEYAGEPFPQDPPRLPDIHSTGGRGRFLIDRLTDGADYQFANGQTRLHLFKRW